jgi:hypothetical protein
MVDAKQLKGAARVLSTWRGTLNIAEATRSQQSFNAYTVDFWTLVSPNAGDTTSLLENCCCITSWWLILPWHVKMYSESFKVSEVQSNSVHIFIDLEGILIDIPGPLPTVCGNLWSCLFGIAFLQPFESRTQVFQFKLLSKALKLKAACNVTPAVRLFQNYWICIVQIFDMGILITVKSY